ncbi:hypothetical protein L210DRAFT_986303 [Boletus edulis BED1]|uniref:Uncharacterized protein n=1 Tax=Boletus edulis BED1 TaxID=1328754 RepID=A0AAD4GHM4_BOLED|nr:hypothetical protein L210DRAFT_986303 [Boletus edulis BED1]
MSSLALTICFELPEDERCGIAPSTPSWPSIAGTWLEVRHRRERVAQVGVRVVVVLVAEAAGSNDPSSRAEEEERADLLCQQREDDKEQALKEECKKNKAKFAPIPDVPVPTEPVMVPAHIALRKLKLNQYVKMWYWTNDGLDTADRLRANMPDDSSLSLITSDDGTPSFVPSTANRSKLSPIPDEDLTFEQFSLAAVCMISAMWECSWDPAHINMFISFWRNIETHPWPFSNTKALGSPNAFSLAQINEATLLITLNDLKEIADKQQAKVFQEVHPLPPTPDLESY